MHSLAADTNETSSLKIWDEGAWRRRWQSCSYRLKQFVLEPSTKPSGHDLNLAKWVKLNRIRLGYGRYASFMHQIGLYDNPNCVCCEIQTHQQVLNCQMIGIRCDIRTVDEDFRMWLDDSLLDV